MHSCEISPSFTEIYDVSVSNESSGIIDVREYYKIYTHKQDINVSVKWGMADTQDENIQLGKAYLNKEVRTYLVDYYFAGSLVWRDRYHAFDGHREQPPECTNAVENEDGLPVYVFNLNTLNFMKNLFSGNWSLPKPNAIGDRPHLIEATDEPWVWCVNRF